MTEKKQFEAPQMKAYQVQPSSIICTSEGETEEYTTGNTDGWFNNR